MTHITTSSSINSKGAQEIPLEHLAMELPPNQYEYSKTILENEINGIKIDHFTLAGSTVREEQIKKGFKFLYIFIKGYGSVITKNDHFDIVPESLLLPTSVKAITISPSKNETLHFLKISSKLTPQDIKDLKEFPKENTQNVYYVKFSDCEAYTEAIKSANTISRTVLPNKYLPRIALGTVESIGPDKVDPHEHAMLEQLFLGLTNNHVVVTADKVKIDFPAYSLLHIPLGSRHSVEVPTGKKMYYMWMDFFLDSKGEEWLKTHKPIKEP